MPKIWGETTNIDAARAINPPTQTDAPPPQTKLTMQKIILALALATDHKPVAPPLYPSFPSG